MWWFPVGLILSENPIGGFRQIAGDGADGDGVAFAAPDALVEVSDVLHPPVGMMALANNDIGGFDEGPFQVVVALLDQSTIVGAACAGLDLGHESGVAGEVLGGREAVDRADFAINDNGEHFGRARHSLNELHRGGDLDLCEDTCFELIDVVLDSIQEFNLLPCAKGGLGRQLFEEIQQIRSPLSGEDVRGIGE